MESVKRRMKDAVRLTIFVIVSLEQALTCEGMKMIDKKNIKIDRHDFEEFKKLLETHEDWLMSRILYYAIKQGYSAYASTLKEAWRLSISGLTESILDGATQYSNLIELKPEENFQNDPIASFGVIEAQRHRERGVSLSMFLGLMKYYRQTYIDLIETHSPTPLETIYKPFVHRVFDRIEIAFCVEWSNSQGDNAVQELQINNRIMTNEKNKYLTIFESIPNPVIILNRDKKIDNMNFEAVKLLRKNPAPGSQYYVLSNDRHRMKNDDIMTPPFLRGIVLSDLLPWLEESIDDYISKSLESKVFEKRIEWNGNPMFFRVKMAKSLDVSGQFDGIIIILEEITSLKNALIEVKTLKGLLPICSHCKKIRDDEGYWQLMEKYITQRSDAEFSHSICPDCAKEYYSDLDLF